MKYRAYKNGTLGHKKIILDTSFLKCFNLKNQKLSIYET